MEKKEEILRVRNLDISFETTAGVVNAVRGVNLTVNRGETVAIVGESGSGKSVSAKAIMGILAKNGTIDRGQITFSYYRNPEERVTREILQMKKEEIRRHINGKRIAMVFQEIQKKRQLSVIYITHDLGVVAKVADYVNVMYAGKIVESGTVEDVFYDPRHPYTWGLLSAMPDLGTDDERLYTIPGSPPNLLHKVTGDAFAPRNKYALNIDSRLEPPMFKISETHSAATWLLHPKAPKVDMPPELRDRIERMTKEGGIA